MKWEVIVVGDEHDLLQLQEAFKSPNMNIQRSEDRWILNSTSLDTITDHNEVSEKGQELLDIISGASKLTIGLRTPLTVEYVILRNEDGSGHIFVTVNDTIRIRDQVSITLTDASGEVVYESRPADQVPTWIEVAQRDAKVSRVLKLLGTKDLDWVNLYRIYEIIKDDIGDLVSSGWTSKTILSRFTGTANSPAIIGDEARHGVPLSEKPMKLPSMSLSEARAFITGVVHNWIATK